MNPTNFQRPPAAVGLLPERAVGAPAPVGSDVFDPTAAVNREFDSIVAGYDQPVGTVYGTSREAELTDAERALVRPFEAMGELAIGIRTVGSDAVQSKAARARAAEHTRWMNSGDRTAAQAEVLAMQAAVDVQTRRNTQAALANESFGDDDDEDDEDGEKPSNKRPRSSLDLAA